MFLVRCNIFVQQLRRSFWYAFDQPSPGSWMRSSALGLRCRRHVPLLPWSLPTAIRWLMMIGVPLGGLKVLIIEVGNNELQDSVDFVKRTETLQIWMCQPMTFVVAKLWSMFPVWIWLCEERYYPISTKHPEIAQMLHGEDEWLEALVARSEGWDGRSACC